MPIPLSIIGTELPSVTTRVERGRPRFFAKAIGETDPIYTDESAAAAAGHPDLPVPPTFLFGLELEQLDPFGYLTELGIDLRNVLHGEQSFTYDSLAYVGDTLTLRPRITDAYSKKGGLLEFVAKETEVTREDGSSVACMTSLIIIRNLEVPS